MGFYGVWLYTADKDKPITTDEGKFPSEYVEFTGKMVGTNGEATEQDMKDFTSDRAYDIAQVIINGKIPLVVGGKGDTMAVQRATITLTDDLGGDKGGM